MKTKAILSILAPVFALSLIGSETAFAQGKIVLEEVVVTAQRREQNLQEVPISVSAYSGDFLQKSNIKSATEYLALTPNVSFTEDGQTGARGMGIAIRGVNNLVSGENAFVNSIGIYLDEFSIASVPNQVANPQLPDMERVEVLRGPQGTFFGRNSVGGALNLTTKKPTDEFEGSIGVGLEDIDNSGEQYSVTGIINVPIADGFAARAVLYYEDSDGYVENACAAGASVASCPAAEENNFTPNGADGSERESLMVRLNTAWDVSDRTTIGTTLIYSDEDQGTDENVPSGQLDLDSIDTFGVEQALDPGTGFWPNNRNKLSHDIDEHTKNEAIVAVLNIAHEINDNLVFKSISGIVDAEVDRLFDNDLIGGYDALQRDNLYEGTSWSTEARLEWTTESHDLIVGLLYAEDQQEQTNNVAISTQPTATLGGVGVLPPFPEGLGLARNSKNFEVESLAIFADFTAH
ncbi:MAG: TonB-dependent receptor, partial [Pseudomonadales bacterium]